MRERSPIVLGFRNQQILVEVWTMDWRNTFGKYDFLEASFGTENFYGSSGVEEVSVVAVAEIEEPIPFR